VSILVSGLLSDPLYPPQFALTPRGAENKTFEGYLDLFASLKEAQVDGNVITLDTVEKLISERLGTLVQDTGQETPARDGPQESGMSQQSLSAADIESFASILQRAPKRRGED
jgi:hypothetical protein